MAYIPPKDITFRLRNCSSNYVLYSRDKNDPTFYHYGGDSADDQWWFLIPGTGDHDGTYLIMSKYTGKVIYSRASNDPKVFHIDGDGQYNDNYFTLEAGDGLHKDHFRLRNAASDTVIFSRTTADPYLGNVASTYQKSDDQYWYYEFEDMVIDWIEYHVKQGRIVSSSVESLGARSLNNTSSVEDSATWTFEKQISVSYTWEYNSGFSLQMGMTARFEVPGVANEDITVQGTTTVLFKTGKTTTETVTQSDTVNVRAPAHKKVTATTRYKSNHLEVPYTIHLKSKATGAKAESHGTYKGMAFWKMDTDIKEEEATPV